MKKKIIPVIQNINGQMTIEVLVHTGNLSTLFFTAIFFLLTNVSFLFLLY